jgi:hypothetical protein
MRSITGVSLVFDLQIIQAFEIIEKNKKSKVEKSIFNFECKDS